jgi:hypothetical protein
MLDKCFKNLYRVAPALIVAGCAPEPEPVRCLSAPVGYVVEDKWSPYDVCPPAVAPVPIISPFTPGTAGQDNSSDRQSSDRSQDDEPKDPSDIKTPPKASPAPVSRPEAQSSAAIAGQGAAAVEVHNGVVETTRTGGGRGASATEGDVSISVNAADLLRENQ